MLATFFDSLINVSALAAIGCLIVAVLTAWIICQISGKPLTHDRYSSLDGLRGYLAYFVFLHHASIWYYYLRLGIWEAPPSHLYNQFGQSGVALFFMITAFLFSSKLLDSKHREIDWARLYVSRFLRLVPLYAVAMLIMLVLVAFATHWTLQVSIWDLCRSVFQWLLFTVKANPNINGLNDTFTAIAGVTWSLPYEWLFYFALPILGLLIGLRVPNMVKGCSIVLLGAMLAVFKPDMVILSAFLGGVAAAVLVRIAAVRQFAATSAAGILILSGMSYVVITFSGAYSTVPMLILSVVFVLIASGNTLFGILTAQVSRTLGEMGYGIYLLHGLFLFFVFKLLIGEVASAQLTEVEHWLIVGGLTPAVITAAFLAYKFIESPSIHSTDRLLLWLRSKGKTT